ncbi:hypothetical protein CYY_009565 [Polysphondylium violaceum]|uniref:FNIP repeat-containing protein n=1 Tax=Polysphondylium violaceum TaxID=133409 RepID=A0A8J4PTG0_9MYCE|nr:hypothetical protein CYY_009565 [Polysphondylium violaceum]
MPPSITHLTLLLQTINTLQESDIPSSIQKIEFKSLAIETNPSVSFEIPKHIASRLVNGVFFIYSKSNNKITIPTDTTHLFWLDDHYINNDDILLPPSVHTLVLGKGFNSAILSLPPSITQMVFNGEFKQSLETICFPLGLKYLSFHSLNESIQEHHLPNGLTHLVIEYGGCPSNLPQSVHHLQFSECGAFSSVIPPQVRHLRINRINSKLHVPPTIKSLITSSHDRVYFDNIYPLVFSVLEKDSIEYNIQFSLPFGSDTNIHLHALDSNFNTFIKPYTLGNNIKSISFGDVFNQVIIKGSLPNSVEYLEFGKRFNQKLNKSILTTTLLTLVLGSDFDQDLTDALPSTLTELMLNTKSKPSFTSSSQFPPNLKKLALPCYDGVLDIVPTTINHLEFNRNIAKQKYVIFPIELVPPHITTLVLNDSMRIQSYNLIPENITSITLCDSITPGTKIPCTVESVVLPSSFNQPLDTIFQTVE